MNEPEFANNLSSDRIVIFHHLTYDDIKKSLDMNLFGNILDSHYDEFVEFCEKVNNSATSLTRLSCYLENDKIHFLIDNE